MTKKVRRFISFLLALILLTVFAAAGSAEDYDEDSSGHTTTVDDTTWDDGYDEESGTGGNETYQEDPEEEGQSYAYLTVYCFNTEGKLIHEEYKLIMRSQYVYPPELEGYEAITDLKYVVLVNHTCVPGRVDFYYEPVYSLYEESRRSTGGIVYPTDWDTQFKPGTSADGKYNQRRYERLSNLGDDDYRTSFDWLVWNSERTDDIPEITAFFDGEQVSSIGIRNGYLRNSSEYYQYARVRGLRIEIYDYSGRGGTAYYELSDQYDTEYQVFSLGRTFQNVYRIDFWLETYYCNSSADNSHRNVIHISDIQFYQ